MKFNNPTSALTTSPQFGSAAYRYDNIIMTIAARAYSGPNGFEINAYRVYSPIVETSVYPIACDTADDNAPSIFYCNSIFFFFYIVILSLFFFIIICAARRILTADDHRLFSNIRPKSDPPRRCGDKILI